MRDIPKGMLSGLVATIVLSLLMVLKAMMGLMPQLGLPKMLAGIWVPPTRPSQAPTARPDDLIMHDSSIRPLVVLFDVNETLPSWCRSAV